MTAVKTGALRAVIHVPTRFAVDMAKSRRLRLSGHSKCGSAVLATFAFSRGLRKPAATTRTDVSDRQFAAGSTDGAGWRNVELGQSRLWARLFPDVARLCALYNTVKNAVLGTQIREVKAPPNTAFCIPIASENSWRRFPLPLYALRLWHGPLRATWLPPCPFAQASCSRHCRSVSDAAHPQNDFLRIGTIRQLCPRAIAYCAAQRSGRPTRARRHRSYQKRMQRRFNPEWRPYGLKNILAWCSFGMPILRVTTNPMKGPREWLTSRKGHAQKDRLQQVRVRVQLAASPVRQYTKIPRATQPICIRHRRQVQVVRRWK